MTLALALACTDGAEPVPTDGTFTAVTYNVHGLPPEITGDDTPARMEAIAPMLTDFDVVGLQEDFDADNHALLTSESDHETQLFFDEPLADRFYGSGLATLARYPAETLHTEHYETCSGVLDGASDCLASKGFTMVRLVLGGDASLDVYDTHLEAGGGEDDEASRAAHVETLIGALETHSRGRAVLFLGDFNLHEDDGPPDSDLLARLRDEGGLRDTCEEAGCPDPNVIDRLFLRDGGGVSLEVLDWELQAQFVDDDGVELSDHEALAGTYRWSWDSGVTD